MKYFFVTGFLICVLAAAHGKVISDPVADFLTLPVEDRYTDASEVVKIHKVSIDIDLDGKPELLVGHHKMWWGDNHSIYFAIYRKLPEGGYKRLTKATEDIGLNFRDGRPEYIFVGRVDELNDTGLLICYPFQGDPSFKKTHQVESRVFVSITGDVVRIRELPGLDLSKESDLAFYQKYFPLPGKQGGYESESLKPDALKAMGIALPDWTKAPESVTLSERAKPRTISEQKSSSLLTDSNPALQTKILEEKTTASKQGRAKSKNWLMVVLIATILGILWFVLKKKK